MTSSIFLSSASDASARAAALASEAQMETAATRKERENGKRTSDDDDDGDDDDDDKESYSAACMAVMGVMPAARRAGQIDDSAVTSVKERIDRPTARGVARRCSSLLIKMPTAAFDVIGMCAA